MRTWSLFLLGWLLLMLQVQPVVALGEPAESVVYSVTNTYMIKNLGPVDVSNLRLTVLLFKDWSEWASQGVLSISYQPQPEAIQDNPENRAVRVMLGDLVMNESNQFTVSQLIRVDAVGRAANENALGSAPAELLPYTRAVPNLWENDEPLGSKAIELTENEPTLYRKAKRIFEFVREHLKYERQETEHSALWAYQHKVGDCSEFSNLFIALARAAGIPAKPAISYNYQPEFGTDLSAMGHEFVLIWLPDIGWRPIDPTWMRFDELGHEYLVLYTSDGSGFVRDTKIVPPSLGTMWWTYARIPHPENQRFDNRLKSSLVEREVALEVKLELERDTDRSMFFKARVKNVGKRTVENIKLKLHAGALMPEREEDFGALASGGENSLVFEVEKIVGSHIITAEASFDSPHGKFLTRATYPAVIEAHWPIPEFVLQLAFGVAVVLLVAILARMIISKLRESRR